MLLQLEQECPDIYRRKIEMTRKHRAALHRYLSDGQTQIKAIVSALGEVDSFTRERGTLEDQLSALKRVPDELESCSPVAEEYTAQRQESEEDKRKSQEQNRLQEQFNAEQEVIFGSRPSTKKPLGQSTRANTMVGTPISRRTPLGRHVVSAGKEHRESGRAHNAMPINYVALPKDDSVPRRN